MRHRLLALVLGGGLFATAPVASAGTVTLVGNLQTEIGCGGDWDPTCTQSALTFDAADNVWQASFVIPAGNWEYKVAIDGSWAENYGPNGQLNGANIQLSLATDSLVKFYFDDATNWITDDVNTRIVTAAGSFQSELGCPGDWQPECLRSWLLDVDGDGVFVRDLTLPAGNYETKAATYESWSYPNYGLGGGFDNIPFTVPMNGGTMRFRFVSATNILTVTPLETPVPEPSTLTLLGAAAWALAARRRRS